MANRSESNGPAKRPAARFGMATIALSTLLFLVTPIVAQSSYRSPQTKDGKPDLNGIWQALDTSADWDIEPHPAQAGPVEALSAEFAVQPRPGIVEGRQIPYLSSALAQRK